MLRPREVPNHATVRGRERCSLKTGRLNERPQADEVHHNHIAPEQAYRTVAT
jgi:hypothetical protein